MIWLTWRLQRTEMGILVLLLAGLIGLLVWTHSDVVALTGISGCTPGSVTSGSVAAGQISIIPGSQSCSSVTGPMYRLVSAGLPWFNFLPLIAAILLAMPLIHELEAGTYRLAWTQAITRQHWESIKLGILLTGGIAFAGVFSLTFAWWGAPANKVTSRLGSSTYDFRGMLPIAHTVFAVALVLFLGIILRRQIATITLASIVYVVVLVLFSQEIRPRLVRPITVTARDFTSLSSSRVWVVSHYWQNAANERISEQQFQQICPPPVTVTKDYLQQCIARNGLVDYVQYHPDSHYWRFQLAETGLFAGAAVVLLGISAWYLFTRVE